MKNFFPLILFFLSLLSPGLSQEAKVNPLILPSGSDVGEITGNVADGIEIPMTWAESSSIALIPATRFEQFDGKQVFYRIQLPANSVIKIRMTPERGKKINLYALRQSLQGELQVPPKVTSVISAQARYPAYANIGGGQRIQNPDQGYREIKFSSFDLPTSILIGVAGAEKESQGEFILNIEIKSR